MQDPKTWVGTSPSRVFWSEDGHKIYFNWNPHQNSGDSLYYVSVTDPSPKKVSPQERLSLPSRFGDYNEARTKKVFSRNGDIYIYDLGTGSETKVLDLVRNLSSAQFNSEETLILFEMDNNLFSWEISTGFTKQLTNLKSGSDKKDSKSNEQDKWLEQDEMAMMEILTLRKEKIEERKAVRESEETKGPLLIYTGNKSASNFQLSPDGNYITYTLFGRAKASKRTEVPNYVTESGYTENLNARAKVGTSMSTQEVWIYNIKKDTVYKIETKDLPGITDTPDFYQDYDKYNDMEPKPRDVYTQGPIWSKDGKYAVVVFRSKDNKDRWIMNLNPEDGSSTLLDRQRDEAWVAGPGIGWSFSMGEIDWMPDNQHVLFQSEESGYSHLYTVNIESGKKKALTKGKYEIYNPRICRDKSKIYFESNILHPGERHLYRIPISGGNPEQITSMNGRNDAYLSPDENWIAILNSYANKPTELYLRKNLANADPLKVTKSTTIHFDSYSWRVPEFITFKARDKVEVHARLYQPENVQAGGPAVVFVHGAGYLQNAHKWWSSYFREYMFHNYLVDNGYTVIDIDYRGSAGYGRDWRTAIYRHMGGWDLNDQVDGAKYLVEELNVDPSKIGIYGGSYGGFITLMALFTQPDVFAAGAALRSVTDWAHYNHGYTANILNTPVEDSIAYRKSSPIYYAEGLSKPLLIAHGMVDTNVHFQDVVRLSQRLIELGKEDWEMAVYPVESHGFVEPSSWTDEYTRIFRLFEKHLK
jgi:dipeptidyl aminopeptidase/acylaminoacyl peptidase